MKHSEHVETYTAWISEHNGILHKVTRSFVDQSPDQDDLLQEIRLAVWQAIPHFDARSKVSSYQYL